MKEKEIIDLDLSRSVVITLPDLKKTIKNTMLDSKIGRALNKLDNYKEMPYYKRIKLLKNARDTGSFHLNGFADLYRLSIKISYPTLYRRIWANNDVLKTLIDKNFIKNPYQTIGIEKEGKEVKTKYWKIQVVYENRRAFIKFIKENFLTESQRGY